MCSIFHVQFLFHWGKQNIQAWSNWHALVKGLCKPALPTLTEVNFMHFKLKTSCATQIGQGHPCISSLIFYVSSVRFLEMNGSIKAPKKIYFLLLTYSLATFLFWAMACHMNTIIFVLFYRTVFLCFVSQACLSGFQMSGVQLGNNKKSLNFVHQCGFCDIYVKTCFLCCQGTWKQIRSYFWHVCLFVFSIF